MNPKATPMPGKTAWAFVCRAGRTPARYFFLILPHERPPEQGGGIVGFVAVRLAASIFRRDDVQRHVFTNRVLDVLLELLVEHLALFNGQLALFDQLSQ